jgi:hypothetical protein
LPSFVKEDTFADISSNIEIKVPKNSIKYYKKSEYWDKFYDYIAIE